MRLQPVYVAYTQQTLPQNRQQRVLKYSRPVHRALTIVQILAYHNGPTRDGQEKLGLDLIREIATHHVELLLIDRVVENHIPDYSTEINAMDEDECRFRSIAHCISIDFGAVFRLNKTTVRFERYGGRHEGG